MYIDFFWNATHALEKYFKASLLLNGYSAKKNPSGISYGHDLTLLFEQVRTYTDQLFPDKLKMPKQLEQMIGDQHWREETPSDYLARLYDLGEANNRYNIFGYTKRWEDLFHLDQMVFAARRVAFDLPTCPLLGKGPFPDNLPKTIKENLERNVTYEPRGHTSRLHKLLTTKGDDELRTAGLKLNFPFTRPDYDHGVQTISMTSSGTNSVLYQRIVASAESMEPSSADTTTADLANWVIANIILPKSAVQELREHENTLRGR